MVTELETPATGAAAFRVDVYARLEEARDDWRELFAHADCSAYQHYDFASSWLETLGRGRSLSPMIVVARDERGAPLALLPLAIRRVAGLRIAEFLGGRESNFNMPLLRPGAGLDFRSLLLRAAQTQDEPPDLFDLRNQPRSFFGAENPAAYVAAHPSPSFAYGARLPADQEFLERSFSKRARKKLRHKERRLAGFGELKYEHRPQQERARTIISALVAQKAARLSSMGVGDAGGFLSPGMAEFLARLSDLGLLETHALSISGRIVAAYVGLPRGGIFSTLANSFDMTGDVTRQSPGDLLLHALLRDCVERGFSAFDLGIGEARYKDAVCEETIELYDGLLPTTPRGALVAPLLRGVLFAKRFVKQTPLLAKLMAHARRLARD
ncbi:MAG TPA: GNAT family N-acetyltransferase [Methylocystis sp.]|nr:GNAT family N-acetyltransferase [Methylocystis sp.]